MTKHSFQGHVEGYVVNFLRKEFWRISRRMEYEDAMQESRLIHTKLARIYPDAEPAHFMSLYKTAWSNHFNDLSKSDTKNRFIVLDSDCQDDKESDSANYLTSRVGDLDNNGMLSILISQAPEEVVAVLSIFINAPSELLAAFSSAWRAKGKRKEDGNSMLCAALGYPKGTDLIGKVERYFCE